jgi:hypothetical protein
MSQAAARKRASPLVHNVEPKMSKKRIGDVQRVHGRRIASVRGSGRFLARPDRWKVCHEEIRDSHRSFGCTGRRGVGIGRYGCPRSCAPCAHACADAVREWSLSSRAGRRGRHSDPPIHFGRPLPEGPSRRHRPAILICHEPRQRWAEQSRRRNWGKPSARRSLPDRLRCRRRSGGRTARQGYRSQCGNARPISCVAHSARRRSPR